MNESLIAVPSNIKHSSVKSDWQTPPEIIGSVRYVLGTIDLDPASSKKANKTIKATQIITINENALNIKWWCDRPSTIYLNPPSGKIKNRSVPCLFWAKLMDHLEKGLIKHAIYMAFSIEQLSKSEVYHERSMLDFLVCFPRQRIRFLNSNGDSGNAPSHHNAIVYVPGTICQEQKFIEEFSCYGRITTKA